MYINSSPYTSLSVPIKSRITTFPCGARWLSGRASDIGARGRGFETYLRRVVSFIKTLYSPKVLVIPKKQWLRPDMTEKLLIRTLNLHTNKQNKKKTFPRVMSGNAGKRITLPHDIGPPKPCILSLLSSEFQNEPRHEKTGFSHMRKQRRRSASR